MNPQQPPDGPDQPQGSYPPQGPYQPQGYQPQGPYPPQGYPPQASRLSSRPSRRTSPGRAGTSSQRAASAPLPGSSF
jgi:hypothetical protein